MTEPIEAKPFPFAIYPILTAHAVVLIVGIVFFIGNCVSADSSITGEAPLVSHAGTIDEHCEKFVRYASLENFNHTHNSVWKAMKEETSFNTAQRDIFDTLDAIVEKDEARLLKLTKRYSKVDFLPAYFFEAKSADVKVMVAYAEDNGPEAAISKLMREKKDKDDKVEVWPYRVALLKGLEKDLKYRKELAHEVWDNSKASKEPNLFINDPEVGLVSKRLLAKVEDPTTAGHLTVVKDLDGNPMIDAFGQTCLMREAYARDMEVANQCIFEKTKMTLVPYYCYRSAYMQAVVMSAIKGSSSLSKANIMSFLKSRGNNQVASIGSSPHQWPSAFDSRSAPADVIGDCLPSYWGQLKNKLGMVKDPAHWQVNVPKPKEGNCTTVKLLDGKTRPFCFYEEKKEDAEGEEATSSELPDEGEYVSVPEGELTMDDLVPAKETPEIVAISLKIQKNEFKDISLQDVIDGGWYVFRYQADGEERFCKVEAHNNHKLRGLVGFVRGQKSAGTVMYNQGCSTYKRK